MSCCGPLIGAAMDVVARRIAVKKALKSIEVRILIIMVGKFVYAKG